MSLVPSGVGARLAILERQAGGRVNRAFEAVPADGLRYCYRGDPSYPTSSWLIALDASGALTIEYVDHGQAAGPCEDDPSTWALGPNAMAFVR